MSDISGARFSVDGKYRFALWRVWDKKLPKVMFIGLNPSTADADTDDNTIRKVCAISRFNGYGGVYMVNCFPMIATNPEDLTDTGGRHHDNMMLIGYYSCECKDVVFAWGNFKIVSTSGMDKIFENKFPYALCVAKNKNGSPKHPLYCPTRTMFIRYNALNV